MVQCMIQKVTENHQDSDRFVYGGFAYLHEKSHIFYKSKMLSLLVNHQINKKILVFQSVFAWNEIYLKKSLFVVNRLRKKLGKCDFLSF